MDRAISVVEHSILLLLKNMKFKGVVYYWYAINLRKPHWKHKFNWRWLCCCYCPQRTEMCMWLDCHRQFKIVCAITKAAFYCVQVLHWLVLFYIADILFPFLQIETWLLYAWGKILRSSNAAYAQNIFGWFIWTRAQFFHNLAKHAI